MKGSMLSFGFPFPIRRTLIFVKGLRSISRLLKYPVINNVLIFPILLICQNFQNLSTYNVISTHDIILLQY